MRLVVPPNAVGSNTQFTADRSVASIQAERVIGNAYNLGPSGSQFAAPVVLTITLPPEFDGIDGSLMPYTIANMTATGWVEVPTTINEATRQLTAALSHFRCL